MIHPHLRAGPSFAGLRIGLLGGSFNPAHAGHLAMSLYALKRLGLDQVWWLVTPQNPLKPEQGMAPLAARLRAARAGARHPRIAVTAIEAQLGTRYTADTLLALRRRFPCAHLVWLMGADNLRQLPLWRRWPEIFARVPVAVFRRPAYGIDYNGKPALRFAAARRQPCVGRRLVFMAPPAWLVLDNRLNLLSATVIRQQGKDRLTWQEPERKQRRKKERKPRRAKRT